MNKIKEEEEEDSFKIDDDDAEQPDTPGLTKWHRTKYCCTKNAILVEGINAIFLGHWEVSLGFPITVSSIIISSYLVSMILIFPCWHFYGKYAAIILSVLFFLFIYSYFRVIIDGPGYFPFYWPTTKYHSASSGNEESSFLSPSKEMSPSGIISNKEQFRWMKDRPRPPRSILSRDARRLVIRPDHFCGWTTSWIGKRNYKFFLLFNTYGFIYISFFIACIVVEIINDMRDGEPSLFCVLYFIYAFFALTFLMLTVTFMCSHSYQMCENQTSWEDWKGLDYMRYSKGCTENVTDVCGPWSKWYFFLFPISPWTEMSNEDLVKEYAPYTFARQNRYKKDMIFDDLV